MIKPDTQTQTFEFKSLEEKSQSFLRFYLLMEEESHVFFSFWYLGFLDFSSQTFQKLFDSAIFLCNGVVERVTTFFWWVFEAHSSRGGSDTLLLDNKTALRVIMTIIIMMITIMYTAMLFLLQFCGFSANFSMLWLTVMNYKSHERNTTPIPHQYCVLSTGMMACGLAFFPPNTNKGLSLLTDRAFLASCCVMW